MSYEFFKNIYETDLKSKAKSRKNYRGFQIYAVDGDDLNLPASNDIIKAGFRGSPFVKGFGTHYPKMYTVYAYNILNGLVQDFVFSNKYKEYASAVDMVKGYEQKSIAIYDRLYCGYPLFAAHSMAKNQFLVRARADSKRTPKPVKLFLESKRLDMEVDWYPHLKEGKDGIKVRLVKINMPRTNKVIVLATSLAKEQFTRKELYQLYKKRWEIETSFRDLTHTLKMNQWHSKKVNGILQEIFVLLWFVNNIKMQMTAYQQSSHWISKDRYTKSNFKVCAKLVIDNIHLLINRKVHELLELFEFWMIRTAERRTHYSRRYSRVLKGRNRKYPIRSKIPRRPAA